MLLPEAESIPIALTINELLTNAIKHSAQGDVQCALSLAAASDVRIAIRNAGRLRDGLQPGAVFRAACPAWAWCARCCRGAAPR